jgi:hypothetical protein
MSRTEARLVPLPRTTGDSRKPLNVAGKPPGLQAGWSRGSHKWHSGTNRNGRSAVSARCRCPGGWAVRRGGRPGQCPLTPLFRSGSAPRRRARFPSSWGGWPSMAPRRRVRARQSCERTSIVLDGVARGRCFGPKGSCGNVASAASSRSIGDSYLPCLAFGSLQSDSQQQLGGKDLAAYVFPSIAERLRWQ